MAIIKISPAVAAQLYETRAMSTYDRKAKKRAIISQIKRENGIPNTTKIKVNILNPDSDQYLIVRNKRTGVALTNSLPEPKVALPAPTVATTAPVEAPKKVPAAKKAATPKPQVVAKPVPVAKKVAAPKPPVVAKKVTTAKPVVTKPVTKAAKPLGSPVKTDKYTIEVRPTVNGKRVRIGYASSEAEKTKMVAAYTAANV